MSELYEMSLPWKTIRFRLEDHLYVMFEHLVKVYYYYEYKECLKGWVTSIRKGFERIKKNFKY